MKVRNENGNTSGAKKPAASEKGTLPRWVFCGFVQAVHAGKSKQFPCDYVRFQVKPNGAHNDADAYAVVFAVTVPHTCGVELEVGDAVIMEGTVNSWYKEDNLYGKWYRLELVADKVREWDGLFKSERQTKQAASGMLERRGAVIYPAGTAPPPKEDFAEATDEEMKAFEAGVIAGNPPF